MRPQTALRVSEWTLFAAIVFTHLAARWFVLRLGPDNDYGGPAILEGLLIAQVALVVALGILGPGRWFIHLPLASCLLWMMIGLPVQAVQESQLLGRLGRIVDIPQTPLGYWLLLSEIALLAVFFIGLRIWGGRIERDTYAVSLWSDSFRLRWSIKSLIIATAVGAILVKAGMLARDYWLADPNSHQPISGILLAVLTSVTMLLCLWTMLRPTDAFYRLMFVVPICGVLAFLIFAPLRGTYGELLLPVAILLGYEAAFLVSTLLLVRLAGFRLVRPISDAPSFKPVPAVTAKELSATETSHVLQVST